MRWLLTYSDLVTLLMVFFILMYSIANVDVEKYRGLAQALHGRLGRPDAAVPIPTVVLAAESAAEISLAERRATEIRAAAEERLPACVEEVAASVVTMLGAAP